MLLILRPPPFLKSGSDVLNETMSRELNSCGLQCKIQNLWSERVARLFFTKKIPGAYYFYGNLATLGLRKFDKEIEKSCAVMINGFSGFDSFKATLLEMKLHQKGKCYLFFLQDDWLDIEERRDATLRCLRVADATIVPTVALKDRILQDVPDAYVLVLEEPIDVERVKPVTELKHFTPKVSENKPIVLWTGNPRNITELPGAFDLLLDIYKQMPFVLRIVSGRQMPNLELPLEWEWRPYSAESESQNIAGATLGLAPLEDTAYNRCKDMYKIKTYLAAGIPPVAAPIGHNGDLVLHGLTGFLASSRKEWLEYTLLLLRDSVLAKSMGINARRDCVNRFSHQVLAREWALALKSFVRPKVRSSH